LKACKTGALESALMDAECARADIERLRNEVWEKLERRHRAKTRGRLAWIPLKAAFWAFTVLLTAATPLALFQEGSTRERQERETVTLEWVTPDEKTLLSNLRRHLSDSNPFASIQPPMQTQVPIQTPTRAPVREEREPVVRAASRRAPEIAAREDAADIPYDRIISLVQAGEKAMKNGEPAIRVEK
jgi:hypothetical protein